MHLTRRVSEVDKEVLDGLAKAGFDVYKGIDESGIARLYMTRGGGYYIDVGCSQLIAEGKIKVHKSPDGIREFTPHSLILADGKELQADMVVLATGYDNMRTTVRKVLGDKVADRCKDVWDLDEEGEVQAVRLSHAYLLEFTANNVMCRCGVHQDIRTSGIWEVIWHCAGFTLNSWLCRSKLSRQVSRL